LRMPRKYITFLILLLALAGCSSPPPLRQAVLWDWEASEALRLALTRLGCPYVLGAQGPWQFDCSGLVVWAYRQAYPALRFLDESSNVVDDATADILWRYNVERITPANARPGDLVFLTWTPGRVAHVGLFRRWLGEGVFELVHASSYHGMVVAEPWSLTEPGRMWLVGLGRLRTVTGLPLH